MWCSMCVYVFLSQHAFYTYLTVSGGWFARIQFTHFYTHVTSIVYKCVCAVVTMRWRGHRFSVAWHIISRAMWFHFCINTAIYTSIICVFQTPSAQTRIFAMRAGFCGRHGIYCAHCGGFWLVSDCVYVFCCICFVARKVRGDNTRDRQPGASFSLRLHFAFYQDEESSTLNENAHI